MQNLKVWEGLAALDRAESQVRAGTYEQPIYSCVQAVEQLPEATSESDYFKYQPSLNEALLQAPLPTLVSEIKGLTAKVLFDFDALDKALKELKF